MSCEGMTELEGRGGMTNSPLPLERVEWSTVVAKLVLALRVPEVEGISLLASPSNTH